MGQAGSWTKQEPLASAHSRSKSTLGEFSRMIHLSRMVLKPQAVAGDAVWIFNLILALGNLTVQKTVHEASEPSTVLSGLWTGSPCLAEVAFPLPAAPLPGAESTAALWAQAPSRAQACLAISVLWQLDQGARNVGTGQKTALPPPPTGGPHCPWPQGVSGGGGVWERSQGMSRAPRLSELPPSFTCSPVPSGSIRLVAQETWT